MPATYTVSQVSKLLGYSTNSIYTFLKEKRLKGVRIGKGRFRIPQSEVDKFLHGGKNVISKSDSTNPVTTTSVSYADTFEDFTQIERVEVPSLFDWFIGVSAVILGSSWLLFANSYTEFPAQMYILIIPMLRGVLVASGIGLLLSDVKGSTTRIWRQIFQGVLTLAFTGISMASFWFGSIQNGLLFGSLALLLLGLFLFRTYTVLLFLIHVFASALTVLYFHSFPLGQSVSMLCFILLIISTITGLYGLVRKQTALLHVSLLPACASLLYASVVASQSGMWSQTLFLLFSALLAVFIPIWNTLTFTNQHDRSFVFGVIGSLLCIFVFTAGGVRLIQIATVSQYSKELNDKVLFSKLFVEKSFGLAEQSIRELSKNKLVIDSMEKKTYSTLIDLSKSVVSGNTFIQHLTIVSTDGEVKSSYPYEANTRTSLSTLPSISQALASKRTVMLEEPVINGEVNQKQIVIAAPILNTKSSVVGVIVAVVQIESIVSGVRQIASESQHQVVRMADDSGILMSGQENNSIESVVQSDPLSMAIAGTTGLVSGYTNAGEQVIVAVAKTSTAVPISISIHTPYSVVLQMKETSPLVILFLLLMSSGSIFLFFVSHRKRRIPDKNRIVGPSFERERNTS